MLVIVITENLIIFKKWEQERMLCNLLLEKNI